MTQGQPSFADFGRILRGTVEDLIEARVQRMVNNLPPVRIFSLNVPFGVEGTPMTLPAVPTVPSTTVQGGLLNVLGIDHPARVIGFSIYVQPAGVMTFDIGRVSFDPDTLLPLPEASMVGTESTNPDTGEVTGAILPSINGEYIQDLAPVWATYDVNDSDLLTVRLVSTDNLVQWGVIRLRMRDLSWTQQSHV